MGYDVIWASSNLKNSWNPTKVSQLGSAGQNMDRMRSEVPWLGGVTMGTGQGNPPKATYPQ